MQLKLRPRIPQVGGWLESDLPQEAIDTLWKYIDESKGTTLDVRSTLVGNISNSFELVDTDNWFYENICKELVYAYAEYFPKFYPLDLFPNSKQHDLCLNTFWVNYQYKHEFNPLHNHSGLFSFVIWLKIPTDYEEQHSLPHSKGSSSPASSDFHFQYLDICGSTRSYTYYMSKECEGKMLFFPARLNHIVYPFFNCDEDRISVSGNLYFDSEKLV